MKIVNTSIVHLLDNPRWIGMKIERVTNDLNMIGHQYNKERKWLEDKIEFLKDRGRFRKLVLSSQSLKIIEGIIVPNEIRIDVLKSLPNRRDIIMLDEYSGIRYIKTDKSIHVFYDTSCFGNIGHNEIERLSNLSDSELIKYFSDKPGKETYFSVDFETGTISCNYGDFVYSDKMTEENYNLFMKVVTYLELTPSVMIVVNGGERKGDIMRGNFIKNETRSSVIHVNSNWNYKMIRLGSFKVRGHFRFQPCGPNNSQIKLIYIEMYEKGLMRRLSQKELQN